MLQSSSQDANQMATFLGDEQELMLFALELEQITKITESQEQDQCRLTIIEGCIRPIFDKKVNEKEVETFRKEKLLPCEQEVKKKIKEYKPTDTELKLPYDETVLEAIVLWQKIRRYFDTEKLLGKKGIATALKAAYNQYLAERTKMEILLCLNETPIQIRSNFLAQIQITEEDFVAIVKAIDDKSKIITIDKLNEKQKKAVDKLIDKTSEYVKTQTKSIEEYRNSLRAIENFFTKDNAPSAAGTQIPAPQLLPSDMPNKVKTIPHIDLASDCPIKLRYRYEPPLYQKDSVFYLGTEPDRQKVHLELVYDKPKAIVPAGTTSATQPTTQTDEVSNAPTNEKIGITQLFEYKDGRVDSIANPQEKIVNCLSRTIVVPLGICVPGVKVKKENGYPFLEYVSLVNPVQIDQKSLRSALTEMGIPESFRLKTGVKFSRDLKTITIKIHEVSFSFGQGKDIKIFPEELSLILDADLQQCLHGKQANETVFGKREDVSFYKTPTNGEEAKPYLTDVLPPFDRLGNKSKGVSFVREFFNVWNEHLKNSPELSKVFRSDVKINGITRFVSGYPVFDVEVSNLPDECQTTLTVLSFHPDMTGEASSWNLSEVIFGAGEKEKLLNGIFASQSLLEKFTSDYQRKMLDDLSLLPNVEIQSINLNEQKIPSVHQLVCRGELI